MIVNFGMMLLDTLDLKKIDNATECISAYDNSLHVTLWNRACVEKFHIEAKKIIGKYLVDLFPYIENDYRVGCLRTAANEGQSYYFPNMAYLYTEQQQFYSQLIKPLREGDKLIGVINIVRDHVANETLTLVDFNKFFKKSKVSFH
jgi:PAS domain-containing protein